VLAVVLLFLFFLVFLVCISSTGFKGRPPKRSTKSKEPGQEEGTCCAGVLGSDWASGKNVNRGERGERRFRPLLAQSYSQLTSKSPSPKHCWWCYGVLCYFIPHGFKVMVVF